MIRLGFALVTYCKDLEIFEHYLLDGLLAYSSRGHTVVLCVADNDFAFDKFQNIAGFKILKISTKTLSNRHTNKRLYHALQYLNEANCDWLIKIDSDSALVNYHLDKELLAFDQNTPLQLGTYKEKEHVQGGGMILSKAAYELAKDKIKFFLNPDDSETVGPDDVLLGHALATYKIEPTSVDFIHCYWKQVKPIDWSKTCVVHSTKYPEVRVGYNMHKIKTFIEKHPINDHKLLIQLNTRELTIDQFKMFASYYLVHVKNFIPCLGYLIAKAPDYKTVTFLAQHLYEESGAGNEAHNHLNLYFDFLKSLSIEHVNIKSDSALTQSVNNIIELCSTSSFLTAFGAIGLAGETIAPVLFNPIVHYMNNILPENDVLYFKIHCQDDIRHSESFFNYAKEYFGTEDDVKLLTDGVCIYLEEISHFWDRLYYLINSK